jgi:hypothetical protein
LQAVIPKMCSTRVQFKWQVVSEDGTGQLWLLDPDRDTAPNDGWNANSCITFGAGRKLKL